MIFEAILGIFFLFKDRNLYRNDVVDYPYLYYLFQENEDTNEQGFKTTYSVEKPDGVFRIILVGGSVARGREPENSIASFLEKRLKESYPKQKIEVLNAGVSAFVVQQEFLLIQMILQDYNPDMIISLDGYNDLLTYKINMFEESPFPLPPHNWPVFQVISENKNQQNALFRFRYFFRNCHRAIQFFERKMSESIFQPGSVDRAEIYELNEQYWKIVRDTDDFCKVKDIEYVHFLQPVRFYRDQGLMGPSTVWEELMTTFYQRFDSTAEATPFATSLTRVIHDADLFLDQCHLKTQGHQIIASEMAEVLTPMVEEMTTNIENKSDSTIFAK